MATPEIFCTKCRTTNNHDTASTKCKSPWPFYEDQWCDRCSESTHETAKCKKKLEPKEPICKTCGHEGAHRTNICGLKLNTAYDNAERNERLRQWTKSRYLAQIELDNNAAAPNNRASASGTSDNQSISKRAEKRAAAANTSILPNRSAPGASFAGPSRSAGSTSTPVNADKPDKLTITQVLGYEKPTLTPEKQVKEDWAKDNLALAKFSTSKKEKNASQIQANFFPIKFNKLPTGQDLDVRKYRIELGPIKNNENITSREKATPDETPPSRETKRVLIEQLLHTHHRPSAEIWTSDYLSHIVSVGNLYNDFTSTDIGAAYSVPHSRTGRPGDGDQIVWTMLVYEGQLNKAGLEKYVDPSDDREPNYYPEEDLRILNLISWKNINVREPKWRGGLVGNTFFPETQVKGSSLELPYSLTPAAGAKQLKDWKSDPEKFIQANAQKPKVYLVKTGFFTSVRPGNGSVLLNVNASTSVFYPEITLQDWMRRRCPGKGAFPRHVLKELLTLKVTFEGDNKTHRVGKKRGIVGFSDKNVSETVFDLHGQQTKVLKHMQNTYKLKFDKDAACVNLGSRADPRWYPADKLHIVEWQHVRRQLDDAYKPLMLGIATRTPEKNKALIKQNALQHIGLTGEASFWKLFGLEVAKDFVALDNRCLKPVDLIFGNGRLGGKTRESGNATWNMFDVVKPRGSGFYTIGNRNPTLHMIIVSPRDGKKDKEWLKTNFAEGLFLGVLKNYGFSFKDTLVETVPGSTVRAKLGASLNAAHTALGLPNFVLVQLPWADRVDSPSKNRIYSHIKWWGDCDRGVATVCVTPEKLGKAAGPDLKLMGNLCLKINFKTGGTNHLVNGLSIMSDTMVLGADVTHPAGDVDDTCPSMAGIVATYNDHHAHYLASARLQPNRTEFIANLNDMVFERLLKYQSKQKKLPKHLLFYRDGVSESQYGMVRKEELPQIEGACRRVLAMPGGNKLTMPLITLVVVGKRHHARFYPKVEPEDKNKNLPSGTVVDKALVAPKQFNFYLQSHDSPLGTARSAHYVVIENQSNYKAEQLQHVTNELCFMGSRATHGLSVCVPARYADILCDRLREYMKPVLDNDGVVDSPPTDVDNYKQRAVQVLAKDSRVWGEGRKSRTVSGEGRKNPWHPNLDEVMFYL